MLIVFAESGFVGSTAHFAALNLLIMSSPVNNKPSGGDASIDKTNCRFKFKYSLKEQVAVCGAGLKISFPFVNNNNYQDHLFISKLLTDAPYRAPHKKVGEAWEKFVLECQLVNDPYGNLPLEGLKRQAAQTRFKAIISLKECWFEKIDSNSLSTNDNEDAQLLPSIASLVENLMEDYEVMEVGKEKAKEDAYNKELAEIGQAETIKAAALASISVASLSANDTANDGVNESDGLEICQPLVSSVASLSSSPGSHRGRKNKFHSISSTVDTFCDAKMMKIEANKEIKLEQEKRKYLKQQNEKLRQENEARRHENEAQRLILESERAKQQSQLLELMIAKLQQQNGNEGKEK